MIPGGALEMLGLALPTSEPISTAPQPSSAPTLDAFAGNYLSFKFKILYISYFYLNLLFISFFSLLFYLFIISLTSFLYLLQVQATHFTQTIQIMQTQMEAEVQMEIFLKRMRN